MKERLIQLLDLEQLTPSKFADIIGVQRSSVSHVISGRNNPSFDFLQKTLRAFPGLNADWLMLGQGTMYEQMGRSGTGNLFEMPVTKQETSGEKSDPLPEMTEQDLAYNGYAEPEAYPEETEDSLEQKGPKVKDKRKIIRVMLLYNDDTFVSFEPS
jgi:transcriptional regulator with XRE-family HTH domain